MLAYSSKTLIGQYRRGELRDNDFPLQKALAELK
jgi:hypothetical protein